MALSKTHLKSLTHQLKLHDERLTILRAQREALERELRDLESSGQEGLGNNPPFDPKTFVKFRTKPQVKHEHQIIIREMRVHEALMAFGRDQKTLTALGDIADDPHLARRAARDPREFAKERGIEIPANLKIDIEVDADNNVRLQATYFDEVYPVVLTWDKTGFAEPAQPVHPRKE